MGGPGSGRLTRAAQAAHDLGDLTRLSRVILEPLLWRVRDEPDKVAVVRAELAARTWQNINPYAADQ